MVEANENFMKLGIILGILIGGGGLLTYSIIEKRINQRICTECGFKMSVDSVDDECPRCGSAIDRNGSERPQHS